MEEIFEEKQSEPLDIQSYVDVVRRRHLHFLLPAFFGWLIVWGVSWILPAHYKSGTLILVEQPTMPKNYVVPNVSDDLQGRLQSITQQILSRTRLLMIIDKLHLYSESRHPITADEKVDLMRKDIGIELVHDPQKDEITAFRIYYSAHNPRTAQQVTSELTDLFISDNLKVRQQESEDTTRFIEKQLESARTNLVEQEVKVREFEGQHEGELPTQQATNLQILSGLQAQLQNEQDALNTAKQQRVYTQALLEQYRALHAAPQSVDSSMTGLGAIDQELEKLKAQLTELSSRYTDRYPEIQSLKSEIARTEIKRDEFIATSKQQGNGGRQLDEGATTLSTANSLQNSLVLQLPSQIQAGQADIENREQTLAGLKAKINSYQVRLNAEPVIEQQLSDLTRGYDQSKANYDDLLKKKNESEMATSMELMQQGERFSILDPPSLPLKPDSPNRLKMCGIGLGIGLVLGLIVAGGVEFMDNRLHSEKEIKYLLPFEIIAEIPEVMSPSLEQSNKTRMMLGWSVAALVVGAIMAGSAYSYLQS